MNQEDLRQWLGVPLIATVLTAFVYLTGRLYTEQFYGEFAVNYRSLQFDTATYMFNGWNVVSTGLLSLAALGLLSIAFWRSATKLLLFVAAAVIIICGIAMWWRPTLLWDLGFQFGSTAILLLFFIKAVVRNGENDNLQLSRSLSPFGVLMLIFMLWSYFLVSTILLAKNHVERAKIGGMGMKIARITDQEIENAEDCWWLVVTSPNKEQTLLYQPIHPNVAGKVNVANLDTGISILVKNEQINLTLDYPKENKVSSFECDLSID